MKEHEAKKKGEKSNRLMDDGTPPESLINIEPPLPSTPLKRVAHDL